MAYSTFRRTLALNDALPLNGKAKVVLGSLNSCLVQFSESRSMVYCGNDEICVVGKFTERVSRCKLNCSRISGINDIGL